MVTELWLHGIKRQNSLIYSVTNELIDRTVRLKHLDVLIILSGAKTFLINSLQDNMQTKDNTLLSSGSVLRLNVD